jgi:predicted transcriptional regulator
MVTTIQIHEKTKKELDNLKIYPRESYNNLILRLIRTKIDEEELSDETIKNIEKALQDIKKGRVYSTREVKKRLKLG